MGDYGSQRALGERVLRSQQAIAALRRRPDWPVKRDPPWSEAEAEAVSAWLGTLQENRAAPAEPGSTKERVEKARAEKLELETSILRGAHVPADMLTRALVGLANAFVRELDALERALPLRVGGLDPGQVEAVVADMVRVSRQRLADQQTIELAEIDRAREARHAKRRRGRK